MKDFLHITLLLDFYGELLTEKQKAFMTCYYFDDLSLSEIAEIYGITPQGVRDLLKRTEKLLKTYELKLKLLEKHRLQEQKINDITCLINDNHNINEADKQKLLMSLEKI